MQAINQRLGILTVSNPALYNMRPVLSKAQKAYIRKLSVRSRNSYRLLELANQMKGDIQANYNFVFNLLRVKQQQDKRSLNIAVKLGRLPTKRDF